MKSVLWAIVAWQLSMLFSAACLGYQKNLCRLKCMNSAYVLKESRLGLRLRICLWTWGLRTFAWQYFLTRNLNQCYWSQYILDQFLLGLPVYDVCSRQQGRCVRGIMQSDRSVSEDYVLILTIHQHSVRVQHNKKQIYCQAKSKSSPSQVKSNSKSSQVKSKLKSSLNSK